MQNPILRQARRTSALTASLLIASLALAQEAAPPAAVTPPVAPPAAKPADTDTTASYNLGLMLGNQLRNSGVKDLLSLDSLDRGIKEALDGKVLAPADKENALKFLEAGREVVANRNKADARAFLTRNAGESGVTSTPSGLQYKVVAAGDAKGASPGPTDIVTVQYEGRLLDGTVFDSSHSRGQPATFAVNQVIRGWQEALLLMKPGSKWQLFIPPELAYDNFSPSPIPPGSLLMFNVELLNVTTPVPAKN